MQFNKVSIIVGVTFFLLFIRQAESQDDVVDDIIDFNDFLANLFNTTKDNISVVDKNFKFTDVPQTDVTFICYLPNNKTVNITTQNYSQVLDIQRTTIFIIHGWGNSGFAPWISEMAARLLENTNSNIISVDWSIWADRNYIFSATAVRSVGSLVGDFIQELFNQDKSVLGRIHVIGHSLGAQAAGFTGKRVFALTNQSLDRITGLDVAGPLFEIPLKRFASRRLDATDAVFVDLVHTDRRLLGVTGSYGKCDLFVNGGGPIQPGCRGVGNLLDQVSCSHGASHEYFTRSIYDSSLFEAQSCPGNTLFRLGLCNRNDETMMGEHVNRQATGDYYLKVNISFKGNTLV